MKRAFEVKAAGGWREAAAIDRVVLDADGRFRRRMLLTGESGTTFLLDLPRPTPLRDGDGLVLEDGSIVRVDGKPERLVEIAAANAQELARLAWHLGNRHTDVQIVGRQAPHPPRSCAGSHAARALARRSPRSRRRSIPRRRLRTPRP